MPFQNERTAYVTERAEPSLLMAIRLSFLINEGKNP